MPIYVQNPQINNSLLKITNLQSEIKTKTTNIIQKIFIIKKLKRNYSIKTNSSNCVSSSFSICAIF